MVLYNFFQIFFLSFFAITACLFADNNNDEEETEYYFVRVQGARVDTDANQALPLETWDYRHMAGVITVDGDETYEFVDVEVGTQVNLSVTVSDDYKFHGWYEGGNLVSSNESFSPPSGIADESLEYQARFSFADELEYEVQPADSLLGTDVGGYDYPEGTLGIVVQARLLYDDGEPVKNAASGVIIDIARETGMAGALLSGAEELIPDSDGLVQWDDLRIDRLGQDYKLSVRYPKKRGPRSEPYNFWIGGEDDPDDDGDDIFEEDILGLESEPFNIKVAPGTVLSWGYGASGQLGVDKMGFPGYYGEPDNAPYDTSWPHMHRKFWPDYLTADGEEKSEGGNIGWEGEFPLDNWWTRQWYYPDLEFRQGFDHYQPIQPHGQFDNQLGSSYPYVKSQYHQLSMQFVAAGHNHSLALRADGRVFAWGRNNWGQTGLGADEDTVDVMRLIETLDNVVYVAAGEFHSLAVLQDGTVWAWGRNDRGQLGTGETSNQPTRLPVQVIDPGDPTGKLQGVVAVEAGRNHNYALKNDGSVWSWGKNADGQLGNNSKVHSAAPVPVYGLNIRRLAEHEGAVSDIAFSHDGTKLVTVSHDRTAIIWDAAPGSLSFGTPLSILDGDHNAHRKRISAVAFSPCDAYVITGSQFVDSTIKLWDAETGGYILDINDQSERDGAVTALETFSDGDAWFLAAATVNKDVRVWELDDDEVVGARTWDITDDERLHDRSVLSIDVTHDGEYVLIGSSGGRAEAGGHVNARASLWKWDGDNYVFEQELGDDMHYHSGSVYSVAIDPHRDYILTASADRTVRLWDFGTGSHLLKFGEDEAREQGNEHSLGVTAAAFCRFGDYILTGSRDATTILWKIDRGYGYDLDGFLTHVRTIEGHAGGISAVAFSPDSHADDERDSYGTFDVPVHFATASLDATAWLHRTPSVDWIASGGDHGFAVLEDNTPLAWGLNNRAQLAIEDQSDDILVPNLMTKLQNAVGGDRITALDGGNTHSLALTESGKVYAWGHNKYGQLGRGTNSTYESDVAALEQDNHDNDIEDIEVIVAAGEFSLLRSEDAMWGMGNNYHGQLGINEADLDGNNSPQSRPYLLTQPFGPNDTNVWAAYELDTDRDMRGTVSGGHYHSLAVAAPETAALSIKIGHPDTDDPRELPQGLVQVNRGEIGQWHSYQSGFAGRVLLDSDYGILRRVVAERGTKIQLRAISLPGYQFTHWSGIDDGVSEPSSPVQTWHAKRSTEIKAHFESTTRQFELNVLSDPVGIGTLEGTGTYDEDEEVRISASVPDDMDYKFLYWTGDDEIEGSTREEEMVRMTEDKTITAVFAVPGIITPELEHDFDIPDAVDTLDIRIVNEAGDVVFERLGADVYPSFQVPLGILEHNERYFYYVEYDHEGDRVENRYVFDTGAQDDCVYEQFSVLNTDVMSKASGYNGELTAAYRMPFEHPEMGNGSESYVFRMAHLPVGNTSAVQYRIGGVFELFVYDPTDNTFHQLSPDDIVEANYPAAAADSEVMNIIVEFADGGEHDLTGLENGILSSTLVAVPYPETSLGELRVDLTPSTVQDAGARWRVSEQIEGEDVFGRLPMVYDDGNKLWLQSGERVTLNEGVYELEFKELDDEPAFATKTPSRMEEVEVVGGELKVVEVDYGDYDADLSEDEPLSVAPVLVHQYDIPYDVDTMDVIVHDTDGNRIFQAGGIDAGAAFDFRVPLGVLNHDTGYIYNLSYEHDGQVESYDYYFLTGLYSDCEYKDDRITVGDDTITIEDGAEGTITEAYKFSYEEDEAGIIGDKYVFQVILPSGADHTFVRFRFDGLVELKKYNPVSQWYMELDEADFSSEYKKANNKYGWSTHFVVRFEDGGVKDISGATNGRIVDPMIVMPVEIRETGELSVTLRPEAAHDYGARWRVAERIEGFDLYGEAVPTEWMESGAVIELDHGKYELEFKELDVGAPVETETPQNREENVVGGARTQLSVDYSRKQESTSSSSSSSDCFIASAAYGSEFEQEVEILRTFRDGVLLQTETGRMFVDYYYFAGPTMAAFLSGKETMKRGVRRVLSPLVSLSDFINGERE